MTTPRAVVFDWDNTLVARWDIIHETLQLTFRDLAREPWSFAQTKAWIGRSMPESFADLFGADADRAHRLFYDHYRRRHLDRLTPLAGAEATLAALRRRGIHLGVVSSKLGDLVRAEAAHLGWTGYFGRIVGAGDGPADKPAPGAVAHALEGGGIAPGRNVWYVGDAGIDVSCARNAGCVAVIVGTEPPRDGARLRRPDHQFADHESFRGFLKRRGIAV